MRPTKEELNKKVWYRFFKVMAVIIVILSFFASSIVHREANLGTVIDGAINIFIWSIIMLGARALLLYIVYGKSEGLTTDQKREIGQWILWGGGFAVFMAILILFVFGSFLD